MARSEKKKRNEREENKKRGCVCDERAQCDVTRESILLVDLSFPRRPPVRHDCQARPFYLQRQ